jgi:hypothetical protein
MVISHVVEEEPVMNTGAHGRPLRLSDRLGRFAVRHPTSALLLLAIPIVVGGLAPFMTGLSTHAAGISRVAGIVVLMLSPTLLAGTALYAPRAVRAVWRRLSDWRADATPQPTNPPVEEIAADLRRLLWHHDAVERSTDVAKRAWRLLALEGAITDCATQAARALDVPYPDALTRGGFDKPQLCRLLRALAIAGLVLPPAVGLLAPDSRR